MTGMPIIIAKVSRSRRTWTNSFTTTAAKRLQANMAISPPPGRTR